MKFGVKVMPREVILDTQGRSVEQTLKQHQYIVNSCRVGKYIEVEVPATDEKTAMEQVKKMAEFVLYNPLIETYQLEKLS